MSNAATNLKTHQNAPQAQIGKPTMQDAAELIKSLETPYLRDLQKMLADEIDSRKQIERTEAIFKVQRIAAEMGVTVEALMQMSMRKKSPAVSATYTPKYRHPTDPSETWTGNGMPPKWVRIWEKEHGSRDGLLIAKP